jgi:hypothetical protein
MHFPMAQAVDDILDHPTTGHPAEYIAPASWDTIPEL